MHLTILFQGDYGEPGPPGRKELAAENNDDENNGTTIDLDELRSQAKGPPGDIGLNGTKGEKGLPGADHNSTGPVVSLLFIVILH